ncbi:SPOR domain-containing protein [Pseudoroseomonas cervicalis]|uniref:SPOR domain-containing protein n=1 Tax=Teichococcus cervicalis TaxID=204525 RepID=UPI0035E6114A
MEQHHGRHRLCARDVRAVWQPGLPRRLQCGAAPAGGLSVERPRPAGGDAQLRRPHRPAHRRHPSGPPRGAGGLCGGRDPAEHPGRPAPWRHRHHAGAARAAQRGRPRHPGGQPAARPGHPHGADPGRLDLRGVRAGAGGESRPRRRRLGGADGADPGRLDLQRRRAGAGPGRHRQRAGRRQRAAAARPPPAPSRAAPACWPRPRRRARRRPPPAQRPRPPRRASPPPSPSRAARPARPRRCAASAGRHRQCGDGRAGRRAAPAGAQCPRRRAGPDPAAAPAGAWGVQVGAFGSANLARSAANEARSRIGLGSARPAVESVAQGRNTLYRARVLGLSRESAQSACEKLRSQGACIIVSPDAQG